jgi:hypothetical protein
MTCSPPLPQQLAKRTLGASFAAMTLTGGAVIVRHWLLRGDGMRATLAAAAFAAAMVALHVGGYRLYRRRPIAWSRRYVEAAKVSLVVQIVTALFFSVILMSGIDAVIKSGFIGYWAGIGLIICRRPEEPTDDDLIHIRWGSIGVMAITLFICIVL